MFQGGVQLSFVSTGDKSEPSDIQQESFNHRRGEHMIMSAPMVEYDKNMTEIVYINLLHLKSISRGCQVRSFFYGFIGVRTYY